jgi:hypothetical protein
MPNVRWKLRKKLMNSAAGSSSFVAVGVPMEKPVPTGYSTQLCSCQMLAFPDVIGQRAALQHVG